MIGLPVQNGGCSLYGGTSYTNAFLGVNYLVILAGFSIIAVVYMVSRFMPPSISGKMTSVTKVEAVELTISAVIIAMVMLFAVGACGISSSISQSLNQGSGSSPFLLSSQYLGNMTFNTGLSLLTNIYSYSISFAIDGQLYSDMASVFAQFVPIGDVTSFLSGPVSISFPFGYDLGAMFSFLSDVLVAAFAPLVIMSLAMLFVQWLSLPIIQATAFVVVLPVAIAMRSFAYAAAGRGLRQAANAILAIAIAAYIVYPVAVSFDPCIISWIYGHQSCISGSLNPSSAYLPAYTVASLPPGEFSSLGSSSYQGSVSFNLPALSSLLGALNSIGVPALNPTQTLTLIQSLIINVAQFMFISIFLFALDLMITIAFAMGLARALDAGLEGEAHFWS